ncbi:MAG TPA: cytidylate kinase-like family protein [Bryobacteraceae bacterium]
MIRIITIEREYGCGAAAIARTLADRLGWKLWDQEITAEIARRLKCKEEMVAEREERLDPMYYRLIKVFMRGSFEPRIDTANLELLDAEHLVILFEKVVTELAESGNCVIVGRGANWFLRHRNDAFHAFLFAPYDEKMRRIMAQGDTEQEADRLLESVDRERAAFIRKYYGKEWPDRSLYDLMINTKVGDEAVVATILDAVDTVNKSRETTSASSG